MKFYGEQIVKVRLDASDAKKLNDNGYACIIHKDQIIAEPCEHDFSTFDFGVGASRVRCSKCGHSVTLSGPTLRRDLLTGAEEYLDLFLKDHGFLNHSSAIRLIIQYLRNMEKRNDGK